jgi:hypothetical protein
MWLSLRGPGFDATHPGLSSFYSLALNEEKYAASPKVVFSLTAPIIIIISRLEMIVNVFKFLPMIFMKLPFFRSAGER